MNKHLKKHIACIFVIFFLSIFINYKYVEFGKIRKSDMLILEYYTFPYAKNTILRFGEFPGWMNSHLGGMPLYANGEVTVFYWNLLLFLLLPISAANLLIISMLISSFLAGFFMYILMVYLTESRWGAVVSSFIFMANGAFITWSNAWPSRSQAIIWVPLVFLYLHKAFFGREWVKYSMFTGIVLGVSFHSGGLIGFMFSLLLLPAFFGFYLFGKNASRRLVKLCAIYLIIGAILAGLSAVKIFPMVEFGKISSKEGGFTYEQFIGQHIQISSFGDLSKIIKVAVGEQLAKEGIAPAKIGWIALALVLLSFFRWRKRNVLFFIVLMAFIILIATGSYLNYPLWKFIPGFSRLHHVQRSLFLLAFAWSVLAGFGVEVLKERLEKATRLKERAVAFIVILLLILIVFELGVPKLEFVDGNKISDFRDQMERNQLMQYLSQREGIFRIHNINTRMIGGVTTTYASHLGLEILYTTSAIWIPEYFNEYLGIASQAPAKFWGMLNTKYVYSDKEINVSGLSFARKFEECEICFEDKPSETGIGGPYLYINEKYLPRAYIAKNGLLVLGNEQNTENLMYGLMLLDSFNPTDTVIVPKRDVEDYEFLKKFEGVFLTSDSVTDEMVPLLQRYARDGGKLFPNVFAGEQDVSTQAIEGFLKGFDKGYGDVDEAQIVAYSPNQRIIQTDSDGFLVLAEKFYLFEGWKAYGDGGRMPIMRANGVNSAVVLDGSPKIDVRYKPKSFGIGATISGLTLLIVLFTLWKIRKK